DVRPEVMIPLVGHVNELIVMRNNAKRVLEETFAAARVHVPYLLGTMIEVPRAALVAGEIAKEAQFFSFGTNDLTQMTFGFSRDDVEGRMMSAYLELGLLKRNPFETLDQSGV